LAAQVAATELEHAFGQVIRELREKRGLSQEALSFECGRHRTYVSLIERGKNSPSIQTLWLLAAALQVRPSEIVRRVEKQLTR
jgi:transcriptional regulator with XRE-family HTH domain